MRLPVEATRYINRSQRESCLNSFPPPHGGTRETRQNTKRRSVNGAAFQASGLLTARGSIAVDGECRGDSNHRPDRFFLLLWSSGIFTIFFSLKFNTSVYSSVLESLSPPWFDSRLASAVTSSSLSRRWRPASSRTRRACAKILSGSILFRWLRPTFESLSEALLMISISIRGIASADWGDESDLSTPDR
jgi:hypothetical protein